MQNNTDVSEVLELQEFRITAKRIAKQRGDCDGCECEHCPISNECADLSSSGQAKDLEKYLHLAIAYLGK